MKKLYTHDCSSTCALLARLGVFVLMFIPGKPWFANILVGGSGGTDNAGNCGSGPGGAGVFQPVLNALLPLARNAWAFGVGILIVVAGLGGLYFILQGTAGAATGGSGLTGRAIIGMVGIIVMVLMAFLLLPQLSCMLQKSAPVAPF